MLHKILSLEGDCFILAPLFPSSLNMFLLYAKCNRHDLTALCLDVPGLQASPAMGAVHQTLQAPIFIQCEAVVNLLLLFSVVLP